MLRTGRRWVIVAAASITGAAAPDAMAATVAAEDKRLVYTGAGEWNQLSLVREAGGDLVLSDAAATITAAPAGCTIASDQQTVRCAAASGYTAFRADVGSGNDTVTVFGSAPAVFVEGPGEDTYTGGAGDDTFLASAAVDGPDFYDGGLGRDLVSYAARTAPVAVKIDGTGGDGDTGGGFFPEGDRVHTTIEDVTGGAGDDTISGTSDANTIDGGPGDDTLHGDIAENAGDAADAIRGGAGDDTIFGYAGDDELRGDAGDDDIHGGEGDDRIVSPVADGSDTVTGGSVLGSNGTDTLDLSARTARVVLSLNGLADDGDPTAGEHDNIAADVDIVLGTQAADRLTGSTGADDLRGGPGNDELFGVDGDDTLRGEAGADLLDGGGGNDELLGGTGDDGLDGAAGDDRLDGEAGADIAFGGEGRDTADYAARASAVIVDPDGVADDGEAGEGDNIAPDVEVLRGGAGDDTLVGNALENVFDGGPGADVMRGLGGIDEVTYADRTAPVAVDLDGAADDGEAGEGDTAAGDVENITGGAGADVLTGSGAANVLIGGPGADAMRGLGGIDLVDYGSRSGAVRADPDGVADDGETGEGDNVATDVEDLRGGSGADVLTGSAGANRLEGGAGADALDGLAGDDLLVGGLGDDALAGGAGDDRFDQGPEVDGADDMRGGPGIDTADYQARPREQDPGTTGLEIDIDDQADDGRRGSTFGERDNVRTDVERVIGGADDDRITGSAGADQLLGMGGLDIIRGLDGVDLVDGGADVDSLAGDGGDDRLEARDGIAGEQVACGAGTDVAIIDPGDQPSQCEAVDDGTPSPPPGGDPGDEQPPVQDPPGEQPPTQQPPTQQPPTQQPPQDGGSPPADTRAPGGTLRAPATIRPAALQRTGLAVTQACDEACSVTSELVAAARDARRAGIRASAAARKKRAAKPVVVGRGRARLASAGTAKVRVRLTSTAKRRASRLRGMRLTLRTTVRDAAGNTRTTTKTIRVARR